MEKTSASHSRPLLRRLLNIDSEIRSGRMPNCSTLAQSEEVSRRTILRDIDYLRDELGAPIEYDAAKKGFRYSSPDWFMPAMRMSEGELLGLLVGMKAAEMYRGTPMADILRGVYRKLATYLPDTCTLPPELVSTRFSFHPAPSGMVPRGVWEGVVRGLLHRRVIEVDYRSPRSPKRRLHRLHPLHLANVEGEWYLFAYFPRWNDVTQFVLSRMTAVKALDDSFEPPANFDAGAWLEERFGRYMREPAGPKVPVRLHFAASAVREVAGRTWAPGQKLKERSDGSFDLTLSLREPDALLPWILSFGSRVRVMEPAYLKRTVRLEIADMAAGRRRMS